MDNTNKVNIKYKINNNIIYIINTIYKKNKCVIYVETRSIVNFRRNTYGASQPGWEKGGLNVEKSKFQIVYCDKIY